MLWKRNTTEQTHDLEIKVSLQCPIKIRGQFYKNKIVVHFLYLSFNSDGSMDGSEH